MKLRRFTLASLILGLALLVGQVPGLIVAGAYNAANLMALRPALAPPDNPPAGAGCQAGTAQRWLEWVLSRDPSRAGAYETLGHLALGRGCRGAAAGWLEQGLRLARPRASLVFQLGQLYEAEGDRARALAVFQIAPDISKVYLRRGHQAVVRGDWAAGEADYRLAVQIAPLSPEANYFLADALNYARQDYDAAIAQYQHAISLGFSEPYVWSRIAHAYARSGRLSQAVEVLDAHDQDNGLANAIRGDAYRAAGEPERAVEAYLASLEQAPRDPWIYLGLGYAYQESGSLPLAIEAWRQAVSIKPDFQPAIDVLCQMSQCPD